MSKMDCFTSVLRDWCPFQRACNPGIAFCAAGGLASVNSYKCSRWAGGGFQAVTTAGCYYCCGEGLQRLICGRCWAGMIVICGVYFVS